MSAAKRGRLRTVIGVGVLLALVVVASVVVIGNREGNRTTVYAILRNASPLVPGNFVKMNGIEVGQIDAVELDKGLAKVAMDLDRSALPLYQDASVTIKPVSLLGERYLELAQGSPDKPVLAENGTIPVERTFESVDLDQLLNSLDDPTSAALAALVTTLGEGSAGQGENIDSVIRTLAPAMADTQGLGKVLTEQNDVLKQLLGRLSPVTKALANGHGQDLDKLVGSAETTLSTIAGQRQALEVTIKQLPSTLQQAQATLGQVAGVSNAATQTLRDARPVTDSLPRITDELMAFADAGKPALTSLSPVLDKAKSLLDQAAPLVRDLRPAATALPGIGASANTLLADLTPRFTTIMDFIKFWALSTNGRDSISNYFRGVVPTTPGSILQYPGVGLGPGESAPAKPNNPPGPAEPANPNKPSRPVGPTDPDVVMPPWPNILLPDADPTSATGLTDQQENSLLAQLLGGL